MQAAQRTRSYWAALGITATVGAISVLHYVTSLHSILLHEIFKRLYYLPIVFAAVNYGVRGGLATSVFASLLFIPHVVMNWHAWPVMEFDQYGETVLFNLVALATGTLADRLRAERNRYREAAAELERAYHQLEDGYEERQRLDRLVTLGRVASGIAHEVRNPLGAVLGSLDILETDPASHPDRVEFLSIAKSALKRLETVVRDFLEFAQPAPPTRVVLDLRQVVATAVRLAQPELTSRGVTLNLNMPGSAVLVEADSEQLTRALLNILLDTLSGPKAGRIDLSVTGRERTARVTVEEPCPRAEPELAREIFEPFPTAGNGHGLSLAVARRLIENQGGTARAAVASGVVCYIIDLPNAQKPAGQQSPSPGPLGTPATVRQSA